MSARLEPGQTYYVFYKAHADQLPAWFTVYSTFSSVQHLVIHLEDLPQLPAGTYTGTLYLQAQML